MGSFSSSPGRPVNGGLDAAGAKQDGVKKLFGNHGQRRGLADTDSEMKDNQDLATNPEGCNKARELLRKAPEDVPKYLLFNLENDKEERHDVARQFPEIVEELAAKLEAYKKEYVPEADEDVCANNKISTTDFGPTRLPWCTDARVLVVYE
jgi:hypothetical protein